MFRKIFDFALILFLIGATGSAAMAQEVRRVASYHDLNLANTAGVRELRRRVSKAVGYVCKATVVSDPMLGIQEQACRQELIRQVEPQVVQAVEIAQRKAEPVRLAAR
jgi:UrcA family protein